MLLNSKRLIYYAYRAVFNRVSKVIDFALQRYMIGAKRSCHFLHSMNLQPKPIVNHTHLFPRPAPAVSIYFEFRVFTGLSVSLVIE